MVGEELSEEKGLFEYSPREEISRASRLLLSRLFVGIGINWGIGIRWNYLFIIDFYLRPSDNSRY